MNFFEAALQGLSAAIDVLSITTDTGRKLDDTQDATRKRVRQAITPTDQSRQSHAAPPSQGTPPTSEADRIAAERLQEMEALRDEDARENSRQSTRQSTR